MTDKMLIRLITVEDVEQRELEEQAGREIINGRWAEENEMAGEEHGFIGGEVFALLREFVKAHNLGRVYPDNVNYVLDGTPDNINIMRIPDVSFVTAARVQRTKGYLFFAPDLAVEVVSPSERRPTTSGKVTHYLDYGAQQVWVIYPDSQQVVVHHADGTTATYGIEDTISGGELLPGFELAVASIFENN